jgi:cysteinyl-tRNA synthetase
MAITLYDPSSQTTRQLSAEPTFEPVVAAVEAGPGELSALRKGVVHDLLQRQLAFGEYHANAALDSALAAVAQGALRDEYERETLRLWLLKVHYRTPLVFHERGDAARASHPALDESEHHLVHIYATKRRLAELPVERIVPVQTAPSDVLAAISDALTNALADDLDTPRALSAMDSFLIAVNAMCDAALRKQGRVNISAVEAAQAGFAKLSGLLGLGAENPLRFLERVRNRRARQQQIDVSAVDRKVAERIAARTARDFARADRLQAELLALGVILLDNPSGTTWTLAPSGSGL